MQNSNRRLQPGDIVEVRESGEIFSQLDDNGTLEGLPFMPEMLRYCGRKFKVLKSFDKIFVENVGTRRIKSTVILEGILCDGKAHGGCQRLCHALWKETWLKRIDKTSMRQVITSYLDSRRSFFDRPLPCQSASLVKATTRAPVSFENLVRIYVCDPRFRRWVPFRQLCTLLVRFVHRTRKLFGKKRHDVLTGSCKKTPEISLNLQPGELVEVKCKEEIETTLDPMGKNRGLAFTPEMMKYCGGRFRVQNRITRLIDERTGKMQSTAHTVMLQHVTCDGSGHAHCPRNCFLLWREIWLKRI